MTSPGNGPRAPRAHFRARLATGVLAGVLAAGAAACDSGPSGPGDLNATVRAQAIPAGAVVVEVTGRGVRGFSAAGDARVFGAADPSRPETHRVVVVGTGEADLRFRVSVDDVGADFPSAVVVSAVDLHNRPVTVLDGYDVRFGR